MKKVSSVLLIIVFVLSFAASPCFSGFAFASSPVTWEDLGEDAIALRDSYYELWSSSGNFSQLFKSAADIPVKWLKTLADGALVLSPVDDLFFTYEEAVPVVQSSTPKGKAFIDKHKISADTPVISSDDFSDKIDEQNSKRTPKNTDLFKNSYRTDPWRNIPDLNEKNWVLFDDPVSKTCLNDLYCLPFVIPDDGNTYFSDTLYHFYYSESSDPNAEIDLRLDIYDYSPELGWVLNDNLSGVLYSCNYDSKPYQYRFQGYVTSILRVYPTQSDYLNHNGIEFSLSGNSSYKHLYLYDSDGNKLGNSTFQNFAYSTYYNFYLPYSKNDFDYTDFGYFCSHEMISFSFANIDTTQIPSGQIVTINGDTIYNYNITNPETGDTSKFGDYITNNYTYITNNFGGEGGGSSGSGVSGNVNVGGSIDVGGSVGVDINVSVPDININVNGNGSGVGESSSLPDTDLVENLPEAPSGFIDFTASLFSFLPADILSLLIAGLAAAIFCRIWGR